MYQNAEGAAPGPDGAAAGATEDAGAAEDNAADDEDVIDAEFTES